MASKELVKAVKGYDNYIEKHGVSEDVIRNCYMLAIDTAINGEKDTEYGLALSARVKEMIDNRCRQLTGGDIFALDSYCNKHETHAELLDMYYEILDIESHYLFDSYLLALERNRLEEDRFYSPKRDVFIKHGLIQGLQDLEDDKLDLLAVSLPPGTGKALPLDSNVLTPDGFIKMRDVKVGADVISENGNTCKVLGVYPQGIKPCFEMVLEGGYKCECTGDHLWSIVEYYGPYRKRKVVTMYDIMHDKMNHGGYMIPRMTDYPNNTKTDYLRVEDIRYTGDKECQCIYVSDASHLFVTDDYILTHNTTLEKFFLTWVIGRHKKDYNLFFSHSDDICRMFYDGVLDITTNAEEYRWGEIFGIKLQKTDAKRLQINFDKPKPFSSLQCTSSGSKNAGVVRANRYLCCDDLIGGIEEALNKNRLDKIYNIYATDARQRKWNAKELHVATRWSVNDVIGRIERAYEGNDRVRLIAVPDIDPETGKSNFEYKYNGISAEFFHDQEMMMDDITYNCLYKQRPVEREGLLYHSDDLRRYHSLPEREPDAIIGVCDVKNKGTDFMFLPCMYQYGNDFYLVDCVCDDDSDYGHQYSKLTTLIIEHKMQQVEFESNNGGDRVSYEVNKRVEEAGGRCNITEKPTETNKETRIIVNADWVKKHVLFRAPEDYTAKSDYGIMMSWLLQYSTAGKNTHDDVPDGLANFALFVNDMENIRPVQIIRGVL